MKPQVAAIENVIKNYRFHAVSLRADGFKNDAKIMMDEANKAEAELAELIHSAEPRAGIHKAFYEKAARIIAEWNADGALGDRYAKAGDAMDALGDLAQKIAKEIESFQQSAQLANDEYFIVEIVGVDSEWHPLYNRICGIATFATEDAPKVEALAAAKATGRVARVARFRKDVVFVTDEEPPSLQKLDRELFG